MKDAYDKLSLEYNSIESELFVFSSMNAQDPIF